jgi:hypothetical protein
MIKQADIEGKLQEIAAKGEQDRLTEQLKYQYELQLKYIDVDMSMLASSPEDNGAQTKLQELVESNKVNIEREKINLARQQMQADLYSKAADRQVKREDIAAKERIAKTNKNKYDK